MYVKFKGVGMKRLTRRQLRKILINEVRVLSEAETEKGNHIRALNKSLLKASNILGLLRKDETNGEFFDQLGQAISKIAEAIDSAGGISLSNEGDLKMAIKFINSSIAALET